MFGFPPEGREVGGDGVKQGGKLVAAFVRHHHVIIFPEISEVPLPENLHDPGPDQFLLLGRQVDAGVLVHQLAEAEEITVGELRT